MEGLLDLKNGLEEIARSLRMVQTVAKSMGAVPHILDNIGDAIESIEDAAAQADEQAEEAEGDA